jgi:nucleotide-binding universal stress UspA family protein
MSVATESPIDAPLARPTTMFDTILVPTDGSEFADRALDRALDLAETFDAAVHAVHVINPTAFPLGTEAGTAYDMLESTARELTDEAARRARDAGLDAETAVMVGSTHRAIVDYVEEHDVDLVSMGTHGRTGLAHVALGSVAERVIRSSPVPVLTVGPDVGPPEGYDDVLVPTDGSGEALTAVPVAIAIAERYDATVHALSVVDMRGYGIEESMTGLVEEFVEESEAAVAAVEEEVPDSVAVETEVRRGIPHLEITDYVTEAGIDLVSMGTHGRSGFDRLVLGSVTERVIRSSPVPVAAVPPVDAE